MNIKQQLETQISETFARITGESSAKALINYSKAPQFGDYQSNGVMALAKKLGRNPRELATELVAQLNLGNMVEKLEVAGPGFINIFISTDFLSDWSNQLNHDSLLAPAEKQQTIVVDYSSPNLAKEMHVGHLRGTCIGDAVVRTLETLGYKVIRQNHFGDWGTQFGMLITYMLDLKSKGDVSSQLSDLETFYRAAKEKFDSDETFAQQSRENVVLLQSGDPQCLKLWKEFIGVSVEHCQAVYDQLNITLSDQDIVPESFYNDKLPTIIQALNDKKLLTEDNGAQCVFMDEFAGKDGSLLPTIVQKSDGGYLYATTDLAAIQHRCMNLKADRILYVVDARQSLHFQQVFAISRLAEFANESCSLEHLSYGTMMGKDGKPFKTRSGDTVKLIDLIEEATERAFKLVDEKNPDLSSEDKKHIAEVVGVGALKYFDLSKNRNSDYVFDWDNMLSFEGNTAPYLLYAYARIKSIFRRQNIDADGAFIINIKEDAEKSLALKLAQFSEVVEQVAAECFPNQLCLYLYELAGQYMSFYEACPILKADEDIKNSRLGLCQITAQTLKQGLELLGIETLEQM